MILAILIITCPVATGIYIAPGVVAKAAEVVDYEHGLRRSRGVYTRIAPSAAVRAIDSNDMLRRSDRGISTP